MIILKNIKNYYLFLIAVMIFHTDMLFCAFVRIMWNVHLLKTPLKAHFVFLFERQLAMQVKRKLLDAVRDRVRFKHYGMSTEKSYIH